MHWNFCKKIFCLFCFQAHQVKDRERNEPPREKTNNEVFEQVRHKPAGTVTEDTLKFQI